MTDIITTSSLIEGRMRNATEVTGDARFALVSYLPEYFDTDIARDGVFTADGDDVAAVEVRVGTADVDRGSKFSVDGAATDGEYIVVQTTVFIDPDAVSGNLRGTLESIRATAAWKANADSLKEIAEEQENIAALEASIAARKANLLQRIGSYEATQTDDTVIGGETDAQYLARIEDAAARSAMDAEAQADTNTKAEWALSEGMAAYRR